MRPVAGDGLPFPPEIAPLLTPLCEPWTRITSMLIVHDGAVVLGVSRIGDLAVWEADGVMCSAAMADAVDAATVAGVGHYAH